MGTGQVHVWFERPADGWTGVGRGTTREGVLVAERSDETGYERLGAKKLSLVDVVAQSVGFMGPVFAAAFLIPAIVGFNAAAKGAGTAAPLAVVIAAIGVFALGWIVAQYAKKIHAAGALYDYVSSGLGSNVGASAGWLYYGGTIILTTGLGVLIGGYVHDILLPTLGVDGGILPIWLWDVVWATVLFGVLYLGVQLSTRVQLILALISVAVVLAFCIKVIADLAARTISRRLQARIVTVRVVGDLLRRPVRRADLRRLRDGREPGGGGG